MTNTNAGMTAVVAKRYRLVSRAVLRHNYSAQGVSHVENVTLVMRDSASGVILCVRTVMQHFTKICREDLSRHFLSCTITQYSSF
jgi:hypothetical protein